MVRACQCSFCRAHGARTTSDPDGSVTFEVRDDAKLQRYRFGARSADFLVCWECGVYLAAICTHPNGQVATLNVNTISPKIDVMEASPVSYDSESFEQRMARRRLTWTPLTNRI